MPAAKLKSFLSIQHLELRVNLGWRRQEQQLPQPVILDIDIHFPAPPKACQTDDLEDTSCYAELIEDIRAQVAKRDYRLVEHLASEVYTITKSHLPKRAKATVKVTKFPKIKGLVNGVCFHYGD